MLRTTHHMSEMRTFLITLKIFDFERMGGIRGKCQASHPIVTVVLNTSGIPRCVSHRDSTPFFRERKVFQTYKGFLQVMREDKTMQPKTSVQGVEASAEASMDEIVRFLLPEPSKLEEKTQEQSKQRINAEDKFFIVRPIKEIDKFNGYKSKNLSETGNNDISPTVRPESCDEDYNCAEYKVWVFNHLQTKSFWDDVKEAGLFD